MKFALLPLRYTLFAFLVISSAITCSVAVWNLSLVQSAGQTLQVDAFLSFLGAFSVTFIFSIVFVEILRKNAVTERLWFEVLWVGLFWIMELSGAAAFSALAPTSCDAQDTLVCTSARVLLAFTWTSTILLMTYLLLLLCTITARQKRDPAIWHSNIREFCDSETRHFISSTPVSPVLPRFNAPILDIVSPKPRLPPSAYPHRAGMGPEYDIQYFTPTPERALPPIVPVTQHIQRTRSTVAHPVAVPLPSLYPQHLQSKLPLQPQRGPPASSTPPPLGNWPRADAVSQPIHSKQRAAPAGPSATSPPAGESASAPAPTSVSTRPPGPRRKRTSSGEIQRPPPLDLTKISSFR